MIYCFSYINTEINGPQAILPTILLYNRNQTYTEQYLELQMSNQNLSVILYSPRKYNNTTECPMANCPLSTLYILFLRYNV